MGLKTITVFSINKAMFRLKTTVLQCTLTLMLTSLDKCNTRPSSNQFLILPVIKFVYFFSFIVIVLCDKNFGFLVVGFVIKHKSPEARVKRDHISSDQQANERLVGGV